VGSRMVKGKVRKNLMVKRTRIARLLVVVVKAEGGGLYTT
jgi:hypothetical protein